jgi:glycosyltransferase involved in cell wall biosynthesis
MDKSIYKSIEVFILHHSNIFDDASIPQSNIGALKSYLVRRKIVPLSVILPLPESSRKIRIVEVYGDYSSPKEKVINKPFFRCGSFSLFVDVIWLCFWFLKNKLRSSVWVGGDALAAFIGSLFQRLHLTKVVVLFATDIVPKRFDNKMLNFFYRVIYVLATKSSDWVWCLSPSAKKALLGFANRDIVVIAGGPDTDEIRPWISPNYDRSKILYLGYLDASKGIGLLLEAFKIVIDSGMDAQLEIIGSGPLEDWVKKKIKEDGIESRVKFHGFVKDYRQLVKLASSCCIGMALYDPEPQNYTYFADPSKVKEYLAFGLPVILTRVPEIWEEIEKCGAGMIALWDANAVARTIIAFLSDPDKIERMRSSAVSLSSKYSWIKSFDYAFYLIRRKA